MNLEHIVTLANANVRLRFVAMERSLRAVGCDRPLRVIPYDDTRFELPANADWWDQPELFAWLARSRAHPTMRKYACLLLGNYQFVDADVVFLRDPVRALATHSDFITSCGHWRHPSHTVTAESRAWFASHWPNWNERVFNSGQFACDRALYTLPDLIRTAEAPGFRATCLDLPFHEQPGLNLLVNATDIPVRNLTLPPGPMHSTWAGDYAEETDYRRSWTRDGETPYLIHWAGCPIHTPRAIDELYLNFLTVAERAEWQQLVARSAARAERERRSLRARLRRWRNALFPTG